MTPFQLAWLFLKSWNYPKEPYHDDEHDDPELVQDNYALDEEMDIPENNDVDNRKNYYEDDKENTWNQFSNNQNTPSEEEMYNQFTQSQEPQDKEWERRQNLQQQNERRHPTDRKDTLTNDWQPPLRQSRSAELDRRRTQW